MHPQSIDEAMAYPWQPVFEECPDGSWRVTVAGVADFEAFASTEAQIREEWVTALRSHLKGYLAVGKVIPVTTIERSAEPPTASGPKVAMFTLRQEGDRLALA